MAAQKIDIMHKLFGPEYGQHCKTCKNLLCNTYNRVYYKCKAYGDTSSASTDWRVSWPACGLYNREYSGRPIMEIASRGQRTKSGEAMENQIEFKEGGRD